jgi:hypothetical protein
VFVITGKKEQARAPALHFYTELQSIGGTGFPAGAAQAKACGYNK